MICHIDFTNSKNITNLFNPIKLKHLLDRKKHTF